MWLITSPKFHQFWCSLEYNRQTPKLPWVSQNLFSACWESQLSYSIVSMRQNFHFVKCFTSIKEISPFLSYLILKWISQELIANDDKILKSSWSMALGLHLLMCICVVKHSSDKIFVCFKNEMKLQRIFIVITRWSTDRCLTQK